MTANSKSSSSRQVSRTTERFFSHVPAGFVLKPIVRSGEHRSPLIPDDLLMVQEADPQQAIEYLPSELRCVEYVPDFEARHEYQSARASPEIVVS